MKSFLVDALREADGNGGDDVPGKQSIDTSEKPLLTSDEVGYSDAAELDLVQIQEEPVDGSADLPDAAAIGRQYEIVEPAASGETSRFAMTAILGGRGASAANHVSIVARIGRYTPVLCLVAMLVAAGALMLVNRLEFNNLNQDLEELSERVRLDSNAGVGPGGWQELPATDVSVIDEIVARNASSIASELPDSAGSGKATPTEVAEQPASVQAVSHRGDSNIRIGVTSNVNSVFDDRAYASVLAAFEAYREQDYEVAERHYLVALDIEPHHSDALAGLAAVYQQTGRDERAVETYQKLLGFDPENTLAASAIISLRSKDADWDAESELKHLLQRFPETHHLHFALGSYFVEQDRWADARHEFLAAHQLAPRNADYSFNVAVSMEKLGEYNEARTYYEAALATAENNSNVDTDAVTQHLSQMTVQLRERL